MKGSCNQFIQCTERDQAFIQTCAAGTFYNGKECRHAREVNCPYVCSTMFHFMYDGNFLEKYNRIQQMPTTGVAIFGKSALFNKGGKIIIWAMNNLDLDNDFALCFEFQVKTMNGEVSLLSNDYDKVSFTYKLTYIPLKRKVRAYVILKDGTLADLTVIGVDPNKPHFVRLAKFGDDIKLRVDNTPAAVVKARKYKVRRAGYAH
ncbi:hypothetical protein FSP39_016081 [Pinctada imbricata]|uniref:Chitin-binding type-2 domain-containing protein n=1 Tax=Pinctada imbricata TaxID=66713 RepID=A0AA88XZM0_PINIB|nr:hypothetical protein FSP39_016081 [Pinctada imbricata]